MSFTRILFNKKNSEILGFLNIQETWVRIILAKNLMFWNIELKILNAEIWAKLCNIFLIIHEMVYFVHVRSLVLADIILRLDLL